MKLQKWLNKEKITNTKFAEKIGVHVSFITHIIKGRRRASPKTALKIEQVTRGAVTIRELLYPNQELEVFKVN